MDFRRTDDVGGERDSLVAIPIQLKMSYLVELARYGRLTEGIRWPGVENTGTSAPVESRI